MFKYKKQKKTKLIFNNIFTSLHNEKKYCFLNKQIS